MVDRLEICHSLIRKTCDDDQQKDGSPNKSSRSNQKHRMIGTKGTEVGMMWTNNVKHRIVW